MKNEYTLGLDIGTTNISAAVVNKDTRVLIESVCERSDPLTQEKTQNPEVIFEKAKALLDSLISKYEGVSAIGITGQMHGILYLDSLGNALSPLYTWQNELGNEICSGGLSFCDEIKHRTGEKIYTGYGLATAFYHKEKAFLPQSAAVFCSIMDYIALKLTGRNNPLIHSSVAASFGIFDIFNNRFKKDKLSLLGISEAIIPETTDDTVVLGKYKGIDVYIPIGDNQASFLGSVEDSQNTVLVNYGTGSQMSLMSEEPVEIKGLETRPFIGGKYLICGSALSGGRAYAVLENFFRRFFLAATGEEKEMYEVMNQLASGIGKSTLKTTTTFAGTRENPEKSGSILNITENNFTPESLICSFLEGMATELYEFYKLSGINKTKLTASGNAARKNKVLQKVLADTFSLPLTITDIKEEAAYGAAIFAIKEK